MINKSISCKILPDIPVYQPQYFIGMSILGKRYLENKEREYRQYCEPFKRMIGSSEQLGNLQQLQHYYYHSRPIVQYKPVKVLYKSKPMLWEWLRGCFTWDWRIDD